MWHDLGYDVYGVHAYWGVDPGVNGGTMVDLGTTAGTVLSPVVGAYLCVLVRDFSLVLGVTFASCGDCVEA